MWNTHTWASIVVPTNPLFLGCWAISCTPGAVWRPIYCHARSRLFQKVCLRTCTVCIGLWAHTQYTIIQDIAVVQIAQYHSTRHGFVTFFFYLLVLLPRLSGQTFEIYQRCDIHKHMWLWIQVYIIILSFKKCMLWCNQKKFRLYLRIKGLFKINASWKGRKQRKWRLCKETYLNEYIFNRLYTNTRFLYASWVPMR